MSRVQRLEVPFADRVELWLAPNTPAVLAELGHWLSGRDRLVARRYRSPSRRRAHLIATALLRRLLAARFGRRIDVERRWNRRPRVRTTPGAQPLALGVSHDRSWVLVGALHGPGRIGLDLESAGRQPSPRLGRRLPWPDAADGAALLRRWTRVEAALKADGRGLPALGQLRLDGADFRLGPWRIRSRCVGGLPGFPPPVVALALAHPA